MVILICMLSCLCSCVSRCVVSRLLLLSVKNVVLCVFVVWLSVCF